MKAIATNFLKFLQGTKQFVIPIYQRTYSWELSDCQQLWNDILTVAQNDILNLDSSVREEFKKHYIAYKTTTNFVDIEPQKKRLVVTLNTSFNEVDDPKALCRDVTNIGHYGNGDVEISVNSLAQIEDLMQLIHQAFEKHAEEVYA